MPANVGKQVAAAFDTIVQQVAATPADEPNDEPAQHEDASADASQPLPVSDRTALRKQNASADAPEEPAGTKPTMGDQIAQLKQSWQPEDADDCYIPTLAQQRTDAFVLLFLGKNIELTTEVVLHVRGDGTTFDDGTPLTNNAVCQRLDQSFIRLLLHDIDGKPIDATNKRRYPTTRQKRVVHETHNHECIDCQSTDLLELDHNPPYEHTRHTITTELEPRCAPCHRARHRCEALHDQRPTPDRRTGRRFETVGV